VTEQDFEGKNAEFRTVHEGVNLIAEWDRFIPI
jgi:hypothetical protein